MTVTRFSAFSAVAFCSSGESRVKIVRVAKEANVHVEVKNLFALIVMNDHVPHLKRSALRKNLMIANLVAMIVTISRAVITKRRNQIAMRYVAKIVVQRNSIVV